MARQPDYRLWAIAEDESSKGTCGAGWLNDDGSVSIKLNPCVVLEQSRGMTIKLYPVDRQPGSRKKEETDSAANPSRQTKAPAGGDPDDDIPF